MGCVDVYGAAMPDHGAERGEDLEKESHEEYLCELRPTVEIGKPNVGINLLEIRQFRIRRRKAVQIRGLQY